MSEMLVQPEPNMMPADVRRAVVVLWLSLLLAFIASFVNWRHVNRERVAFTVFVQICTYGLLALLNWKISQGRGWARITWLLLFAGGAVVMALFTIYSKFYRAEIFGSPFSAAVVVVQTAIQFCATVLLFTPNGRTWFLRKRSR